MWRGEEYQDLLIMQRALMACIERAEIKPTDLAACARALVVVLDRKRIMRMQPKPKDIDVSKLLRRRRAAESYNRPLFRLAEPTAAEPTDQRPLVNH